jgi:hypothetical protein
MGGEGEGQGRGGGRAGEGRDGSAYPTFSALRRQCCIAIVC